MKRPKSIVAQLNATIDNLKADIKDMQGKLSDKDKQIEAANARNKDLRELLQKQASALVEKDRMISILQKNIPMVMHPLFPILMLVIKTMVIRTLGRQRSTETGT